jgi:hypothetical protein
VLQDRLLSSLLVLEEEAGRLGLPSALEPIGPEFPTAKRAVFSVILNRNPVSTRTAEPSVTLAQLTAALFRDPAWMSISCPSWSCGGVRRVRRTRC